MIISKANETGRLMETIFSKIIRGEIPCQKVYEDEDVFAFRDINPAAPVHILVVPKQYVRNLAEADQHPELMGKLIVAVAKIARAEGLEEGGYRVVSNINAGGGQSVFHLHWHIIGGRSLSWPPG
jgi:histidine triad (HIT) family protein